MGLLEEFTRCIDQTQPDQYYSQYFQPDIIENFSQGFNNNEKHL